MIKEVRIMYVEFRLLKYFLAVAREENITKAANVLHITQPTLSRQLAQLEEDLNVKLFIRGKRSIVLTNEGMLLRRRAEEIIDLVDKTQKELLEQEANIDGTITIGYGELYAVDILARIIKEFKKKHPLLKFNLYTASGELVKERLDRGLIDIGIFLESINKEKFEVIPIPIKERWVVVMRNDAPLAAKSAVNVADLKNVPLILPEHADRSELVNYFGDDFADLQVDFMSNLTTNSSIMVKYGLGYSLVIEGSLPFVDNKNNTGGICYRPLSPDFTTSSFIAWKRQQPSSLAVEKFIEHTKCFLSMMK